jgi:hypothetical protein
MANVRAQRGVPKATQVWHALEREGGGTLADINRRLRALDIHLTEAEVRGRVNSLVRRGLVSSTCSRRRADSPEVSTATYSIAPDTYAEREPPFHVRFLDPTGGDE